MTGIVAERTVFESQFPSVLPAEIVDLDYPPFALLPIVGRLEERIRTECRVDLEDFAYTDECYFENVMTVIRYLVAYPSEATLAFVASELHGSSGAAFGCALRRGETKVFRDVHATWPETKAASINYGSVFGTLGLIE